MLYKYDQKSLNKEIKQLNSTGFTKIIKTDQKKECLEILFYCTELKYEIYFYMDISPSNNYFQKKNNKVIKSGLFQIDQLNALISSFYESYIPEQHKELKDFFILLKEYLSKNFKKKDESNNTNNYSKDLIYIYNNLNNFSKTKIIFITLSIHFFAILLKILVGQFGYSGEGDYPRFGDFEAQRHWMEITVNLPIQEWYTNSRSNRGDYWPLDYPPMSGYHSYIFGKILQKYIPKSVELKKSKGYESPIFKIVMRFFALISDVLVFHVAVNLICLYIFIYSKKSKNKKPLYSLYYIVLLLILINPLMIIIDHGHFQFNNVMHGFFVFALFFLYTDNYILAIIFYSLCINFKQMGLYYAIPFPLYVIKKLFFNKSKNNENNNTLISIIYIGIYGIITLISNILIYLPWLKAKKMNDVFDRIFPVRRGIFEDKVATFWCTINIFIKLNQVFKLDHLFKLALFFTLIGCSLPIYGILTCQKITKKICTQSFFIVSLAFYLFSFHVHEKTIIVPFLAYLLNLPNNKDILPSFTLIGMFSLFPLLKRENQVIPYYLTSILFYLISKYALKLMDIRYDKKEKSKEKHINKEEDIIMHWLFELCVFIIMIFYHFVDYSIPPPQNYPWFYPMLNASFCFCYFFTVFLHGNYDLLRMINKKNDILEKDKRD